MIAGAGLAEHVLPAYAVPGKSGHYALKDQEGSVSPLCYFTYFLCLSQLELGSTLGTSRSCWDWGQRPGYGNAIARSSQSSDSLLSTEQSGYLDFKGKETL